MTYSLPELMLVGAASNLVLDTSPAGNPKCDETQEDLPKGQYIYTIDEDAW